MSEQHPIPVQILALIRAEGLSADTHLPAQWLADRRFRRVRLVTTDWHMRRALSEFRTSIPAGVEITGDAVASNPPLGTLFLEYNKLLASEITRGFPSLRQ